MEFYVSVERNFVRKFIRFKNYLSETWYYTEYLCYAYAIYKGVMIGTGFATTYFR